MGRYVLSLEPVDLAALFEQVRIAFQVETKEKQLEWRVGALPTVLCDAGLVRQVFENLISNAVKYTRKRECAVIEARQTIVHGTPAFFVRDNGAGFDMKHAANLFGAFQRLHDQSEFEGTGIGLATVQRIVQRHGGRIWAESVPDKGATFYFTLEPAAETFVLRRN